MAEMELIQTILSRSVKVTRLRNSSEVQELGNTETALCEMCRGAGYVHPMRADGKVDYSAVVPCVCQADKIKTERDGRYRQFCHLPAASDRMTFETFQANGNKTLQSALNYASLLAQGSEDVKWLTLIGTTGCGKTHLAVAVCRYWLAAGKVARYGFVPILLKELKDGFELTGEYSYRQRFDALCNIPLLVLDDLGAEKATEWAQEQLQTIIHYRGFNGLPLVVTTNRPLDDLKGDDLGRIASRLRREPWCKVVTITAGEFRR